MILRGVVGFKPPLSGTAALCHYLCCAKRSHLYWEVSFGICIEKLILIIL